MVHQETSTQHTKEDVNVGTEGGRHRQGENDDKMAAVNPTLSVITLNVNGLNL